VGEHTPTPWVIPTGIQNGFIICAGDDPDKPGEILMVLRAPYGRKGVLTDLAINANAAFIVKAVNNHEALVKALKLARQRIEYLGTACSNPKHFEANEKTFLPALDEVLVCVGTVNK
jgi:hypothetical protein